MRTTSGTCRIQNTHLSVKVQECICNSHAEACSKAQTAEIIYTSAHVFVVSSTHITIVGRGDNILEFLAGKDIDCHEVTLGVTMLPSLRGRHLDHLPQTANNMPKVFVHMRGMRPEQKCPSNQENFHTK